MFKEILNNIRKHANADIVDIDLDYSRGHLLFKITDNGVGFDASKVSPKRNGLLNLKSRAEKWKGSFEIKSLTVGGTQVLLTIPYDRISLRVLINRLKHKRRLLQRLNFYGRTHTS
ncbi:hypothetical protein GM921_00820 [Pedobacter sp. LMG 31464]|uniref:Histidine kinase/HSP90-like ATPase domain-containing protein n=1 Tax=Pedobacter planticolens TaxID=2679964 RepID=A0A923ITT3_9SPHI|nr:ATP-binding protein [Pedobacter planticolens]MBB2144013.1 hypothetical protein [Pedobacter planticolens]